MKISILGVENMYIAFGNEIMDSEEMKEKIEKNSEFKVIKDMSKGSKREDILAFNLSVEVNILNEIMEDEYNLDELTEDDLFEEYLTLAEEIATDIEEHIPEEALLDIRGYKWDKSDNSIKLVMAIAHEELGEGKLKDVMRRLITQVEQFLIYRNDLTTGCEIGIYVIEEPDLDIPGVLKGPFYHSISNEKCLQTSFSLKKRIKYSSREDKHWWLTGFKLGEFSEPSELNMDLLITLKNKKMLNAFVEALNKVGYSEKEITVNSNIGRLTFDKARMLQPITRMAEIDEIIQMKNELLCDKYKEITGPYNNLPDKTMVIKEKEPEIYENIINIDKSRKLFKDCGEIKNKKYTLTFFDLCIIILLMNKIMAKKGEDEL